MSTREKTATVQEYLESEFPGFSIEGRHEAARRMHRFTLSHQGKTHYALITEEFLDDHDIREISELLRKFLLAEHLREMNTTPVLVTSSGLSLEHE